MAIEPVKYEQAMRESLVEVMGKLDRVITAVNAQPSTDSIKESLQTINSQLKTIQSDIDKIKVTLYTPIKSS